MAAFPFFPDIGFVRLLNEWANYAMSGKVGKPNL
jgi:hypothetical protein